MTTAPSPQPDEATQPAAPTPPAPSRGWAPLRPLILRLHFYVGVLVAPFLLVAAVTGLLYAASFQAEKIVYADELTVSVGDTKLPVSEQVAAARQAHPEGTVTAVRPSPAADATTRVLLSGVPGVDADHTLAVFVDPYTAKVEGALEQYGATGALPLRTWIDELHRDLHLGETGRLYSELAASWLWVIASGGLVLWFSRRRALRLLRGTTGRRRTLGLHGTVGAWAAAGFLFLSATGLTWSAYAGANIDELRTSLGGATPAVAATAAGDHAEHGGAAPSGDRRAAPGVGLDKVLAAARAEGLTRPRRDPGARRRLLRVRRQAGAAQLAREAGLGGGRPGHRRGPGRAAVRRLSGPRQTDPLGDRPALRRPVRPGQPDRADAARRVPDPPRPVGLPHVVAARPGSAFGRPIPRGAWAEVPPQILVPLLAAVAVVGYFVPLLGIPLAVFLAVDVVLGEIAHRRGRRTYAAK
ncbi:hypothetical protein SGLAM104S_09498 [Streptomyces glaucescens]